MATITTNQYNDENARTAGEAITINSGAVYTIRTDTRWHINSPASMTGSIGLQTCNEGELVYDGTQVRWIQISDGSGTPAIGDTISQGGISGYYLGYWANLTSAPALTIGATGFIKFREVTGGTFSAGALTFSGDGAATAVSADVAGWIEIVSDDALNHAFPRLGKHSSRGDWFYLANTDGTVGQVIDTPTNGGGTGTRTPGVWIETGVATGVYEFWPGLYGDPWSRIHLGAALGEQDARQNFVKDIGGGQFQISEASDLSATYANIAAQESTYVEVSQASTYTWDSDIVTITYTTGHLLKTGAIVGLDFTSGDATANDGNYTITVLDAYNYTVPLAGSGAAGNVTVRPGITITFTAHTLGVGDSIYCDFTSGTGVDGSYTIYAVYNSSTYRIAYPSTSAITAGNVSTYSRYKITYNAHGLNIGNRVYLDFTSGSGVNGIYTIVAVATNDFDIVLNNGASADSGNVTIKQIIGNTPVSGCRVRIPNIILRGCVTTTRESNSVHATLASRPEWATTTAGTIDLEYLFSTWYHNYSQPYSVSLTNIAYVDSMNVTECATAIYLDNIGNGTAGTISTGIYPLYVSSNFAGGTISNSKIMRGDTPGSSAQSFYMQYNIGITCTNIITGVIQYVRGSGYGLGANYCSNLTVTNFSSINSGILLTGVTDSTITNVDHTDRCIGYTNATTPHYAISTSSLCSNIIIDGVTWGRNGTIINNHSNNGIASIGSSDNIIVRNCGTVSSPLLSGNWRPNYYSMHVLANCGGNGINNKFQRMYCNENRTNIIASNNSDKNFIFEHLYGGIYAEGTGAISFITNATLNQTVRSCRSGANNTGGQSSVYGTHFYDMFMSDTKGRFVLAFNEPLVETVGQFTMNVGTAKFNSAGGIILGYSTSTQMTWEDNQFRKGHTGFINTAPIMLGGTIASYTLEYDIDIGSGYSDSWTTLDGTNLSAITVNPSIGFKMKYRITCTTLNNVAMTSLRIETTTTYAAQTENLYSLLTPVSITVIAKDATTLAVIENARVLMLADTGGDLPSEATVTIVNSGTTATVTHAAHGLLSGDKVQILGGSLLANQGVFTIVYIDTGSYSYTMSSSPGSSPTGTIKATAVIISALTNASGIATISQGFSSDQPIKGRIRQATSGTLYSQTQLVGTISKTLGLLYTILMIPDQ